VTNFATETADIPTKKAPISKKQMETVLNTFFDVKGIVHFEFIPQGQTVNEAYYVNIVKGLCEAVCGKRPQLWLND
jgi:hypothetical protein